MSHDTVYKNEEMITQLDPDVKRRVSLMAGQVEVADREFDRLNMDLATTPTARLLQVTGTALLHLGISAAQSGTVGRGA
jgi:hypothetical protein